MKKRDAHLLALSAVLTIVGTALVTRAAAPAGRYTVTSGTVYDTKTKLTWQQTFPTGVYTQAQAAAYCLSLSLNGTGWRLPTMMELVTLVDYSVAYPGPTIAATVFPNTPGSGFRTSTPYAGASGSAWLVFFSNGVAVSYDVSYTYYVRCVR